MAIEREPKPLPSELNYVPPGSTPYKVKSTDSWWTLADRPEVKATNMSANDLCYFNFKSRKPPEINWYLHHKVGCKTQTSDGKNYRFSNADDPGIVYLPTVGAPPPVNEYPPPDPGTRLNAWLGVGGKVGSQIVAAGIETLAGVAFSLDDIPKAMAITASINRIGPGVGVSGGACLIWISGVSSPEQVNGLQSGGWDFSLSIGPKWDRLVKLGKLAKFKPLIEALMKLGAYTPSGLKKLLKAKPEKWAELVKTVRALQDSLDIDPNGEPNVFLLDLPLSGGTELSVYYGISNFNAVLDTE